MLQTSGPGVARATVQTEGEVPGGAVWFDLFDPTDDERRVVEAATGLRVPLQEEIVEIEASSRLRQEGSGLYLSMPVAAPVCDGPVAHAALGFVLSERFLISLRFTALPVFDRFAQTLPKADPAGGSSELLVGLLEAVVDRLADLLEQVSASLDTLSKRIFHTEHPNPRGSKSEDAALRATLRQIGLAGDLTSTLRGSLLGIGRIVAYVAETAAFVPHGLRPRFASMRQDIASLAEFDVQLGNKIQFLLDATLGFLNIEQNNGLKVLTVVSVVGIPPTLIASIYGMNFKFMPELGWQYGYPYGLAMIVLSIVLPLVWFRIKGWM